MARKLLLLTLFLSAISELVLSAAGLFAPERMLTQFRLAATADTLFLVYVVAWFLIALGACCALATRLVARDEPSGTTLARVLGLWWLGIGLALFLKFGRAEHLVLDSLRGALILVLCQLAPPATSRGYAGKLGEFPLR